jgi:hypothetical protein
MPRASRLKRRSILRDSAFRSNSQILQWIAIHLPAIPSITMRSWHPTHQLIEHNPCRRGRLATKASPPFQLVCHASRASGAKRDRLYHGRAGSLAPVQMVEGWRRNLWAPRICFAITSCLGARDNNTNYEQWLLVSPRKAWRRQLMNEVGARSRGRTSSTSLSMHAERSRRVLASDPLACHILRSDASA